VITESQVRPGLGVEAIPVLLDGPGEGQLMGRLTRAPSYLRVVESPASGRNGWDALCALDDTPLEIETIHVYGLTFLAHVCGRGKGAPSGWTASYTYIPLDADTCEGFRSNANWRRWVMEQSA
jgi:hypothetical protein